ncbi:hypothetical protein BGZ99_000773 [Dissophora globulifera]|uniref:Uncharacterized protein n=1 Tax=Dissophora globulifera TaxID=979702 RepID=A0A9P6R1D3_9FUNG|nr:hypothetical protein BGZ99_000773 [Dissophora globulifera]
MSTSADESNKALSSPPSSQHDINAIVPGSIFQDDIPPPTFNDGTSGYDNPSNVSTTISGAAGANTNSNVNNQIEVSSTIQTIMISLGICVGALFLLGVIATHYISHKNTRAEEKKKKALEEKEGDAAKETGVGGASAHHEMSGAVATTAIGSRNTGYGLGLSVVDASRRGSIVTVLIDDKDGGAGVGSDLMSPAPAAPTGLRGKIGMITGSIGNSQSSNSNYGHNNNASPKTAPFRNTHSPKCSIIGGVGTAIGGGGHAGTGSFQMGASGPRGPGSVNPRNSFMEVAQVYTRRQSITPTPPVQANGSPLMAMHSSSSLRAATPGYSHDHRHHAAPPDLQIIGGRGSVCAEGSSGGLYPRLGYGDDNPLSLTRSQHDLTATSPMFALSPSSFGTDTGPDRNPFASPPLSAISKSSLLLDPFRTQNNSQLSLNLANSNEDNPTAEDGDDDDSYPFPSTANSDSHTVAALSGPPTSFTAGTGSMPRSLDDFSEPRLVLRQIQSGVPAYQRHTMMQTGTAATPSAAVAAVTPNIFGGGSPGSSNSSAITHPSVERQVGYIPGVPDRRSIAGSVVVPSNNTGGNGNNSYERHASKPSTGVSSINEGNAWYRKRASVIIPESGTAHVRLWKDGETTMVVNRSSRSGSQSSALSHLSNSSMANAAALAVAGTSAAVMTITEPSPLRINHSQDAIEKEPLEQPDSVTKDKHASLFPRDASDTVVARNGAAVFEGTQTSRSRSRSPSPLSSRASPEGGSLTPVVLIQGQESKEQDQDQENEVVVRLRAPRRGSHAGSTHSNRRSYLDDYREQQQQQQ